MLLKEQEHFLWRTQWKGKGLIHRIRRGQWKAPAKRSFPVSVLTFCLLVPTRAAYLWFLSYVVHTTERCCVAKACELATFWTQNWIVALPEIAIWKWTAAKNGGLSRFVPLLLLHYANFQLHTIYLFIYIYIHSKEKQFMFILPQKDIFPPLGLKHKKTFHFIMVLSTWDPQKMLVQFVWWFPFCRSFWATSVLR